MSSPWSVRSGYGGVDVVGNSAVGVAWLDYIQGDVAPGNDDQSPGPLGGTAPAPDTWFVIDGHMTRAFDANRPHRAILQNTDAMKRILEGRIAVVSTVEFVASVGDVTVDGSGNELTRAVDAQQYRNIWCGNDTTAGPESIFSVTDLQGSPLISRVEIVTDTDGATSVGSPTFQSANGDFSSVTLSDTLIIERWLDGTPSVPNNSGSTDSSSPDEFTQGDGVLFLTSIRPGDRINILTGPEAGVYTVAEVINDTTVRLTGADFSTQSPLDWYSYREDIRDIISVTTQPGTGGGNEDSVDVASDFTANDTGLYFKIVRPTQVVVDDIEDVAGGVVYDEANGATISSGTDELTVTNAVDFQLADVAYGDIVILDVGGSGSGPEIANVREVTGPKTITLTGNVANTHTDEDWRIVKATDYQYASGATATGAQIDVTNIGVDFKAEFVIGSDPVRSADQITLDNGTDAPETIDILSVDGPTTVTLASAPVGGAGYTDAAWELVRTSLFRTRFQPSVSFTWNVPISAGTPYLLVHGIERSLASISQDQEVFLKLLTRTSESVNSAVQAVIEEIVGGGYSFGDPIEVGPTPPNAGQSLYWLDQRLDKFSEEHYVLGDSVGASSRVEGGHEDINADSIRRYTDDSSGSALGANEVEFIDASNQQANAFGQVMLNVPSVNDTDSPSTVIALSGTGGLVLPQLVGADDDSRVVLNSYQGNGTVDWITDLGSDVRMRLLNLSTSDFDFQPSNVMVSGNSGAVFFGTNKDLNDYTQAHVIKWKLQLIENIANGRSYIQAFGVAPEAAAAGLYLQSRDYSNNPSRGRVYVNANPLHVVNNQLLLSSDATDALGTYLAEVRGSFRADSVSVGTGDISIDEGGDIILRSDNVAYTGATHGEIVFKNGGGTNSTFLRLDYDVVEAKNKFKIVAGTFTNALHIVDFPTVNMEQTTLLNVADGEVRSTTLYLARGGWPGEGGANQGSVIITTESGSDPGTVRFVQASATSNTSHIQANSLSLAAVAGSLPAAAPVGGISITGRLLIADSGDDATSYLVVGGDPTATGTARNARVYGVLNMGPENAQLIPSGYSWTSSIKLAAYDSTGTPPTPPATGLEWLGIGSPIRSFNIYGRGNAAATHELSFLARSADAGIHSRFVFEQENTGGTNELLSVSADGHKLTVDNSSDSLLEVYDRASGESGYLTAEALKTLTSLNSTGDQATVPNSADAYHTHGRELLVALTPLEESPGVWGPYNAEYDVDGNHIKNGNWGADINSFQPTGYWLFTSVDAPRAQFMVMKMFGAIVSDPTLDFNSTVNYDAVLPSGDWSGQPGDAGTSFDVVGYWIDSSEVSGGSGTSNQNANKLIAAIDAASTLADPLRVTLPGGAFLIRGPVIPTEPPQGIDIVGTGTTLLFVGSSESTPSPLMIRFWDDTTPLTTSLGFPPAALYKGESVLSFDSTENTVKPGDYIVVDDGTGYPTGDFEVFRVEDVDNYSGNTRLFLDAPLRRDYSSPAVYSWDGPRGVTLKDIRTFGIMSDLNPNGNSLRAIDLTGVDMMLDNVEIDGQIGGEDSGGVRMYALHRSFIRHCRIKTTAQVGMLGYNVSDLEIYDNQVNGLEAGIALTTTGLNKTKVHDISIRNNVVRVSRTKKYDQTDISKDIYGIVVRPDVSSYTGEDCNISVTGNKVYGPLARTADVSVGKTGRGIVVAGDAGERVKGVKISDNEVNGFLLPMFVQHVDLLQYGGNVISVPAIGTYDAGYNDPTYDQTKSIFDTIYGYQIIGNTFNESAVRLRKCIGGSFIGNNVYLTTSAASFLAVDLAPGVAGDASYRCTIQGNVCATPNLDAVTTLHKIRVDTRLAGGVTPSDHVVLMGNIADIEYRS